MKKYIIIALLLGLIFEGALKTYATSTPPDYSNPVFNGGKFIVVKQNGKTIIQHKFSFGSIASEVNYVFQTPYTETFTIDENTAFTSLNNAYAGKKFEIFAADTNVRKVGTNNNIVYLLAFTQTDGNYTIGGLYVISPTVENGSCDSKYTTSDGYTAGGTNVQPIGTASSNSQQICIYNVSTYNRDSSHNVLVNDNYNTYVNALANYLPGKNIKTAVGSSSINMTPTTQEISDCKNDNLSGTFNTKYPVFINTFIDALTAQVQADRKQGVKDLLTSNDVKVSNAEDLNLYQDFYATDPSLGYANKYIDTTMQGKFVDLLNKVSTDQAYYDVYSNKTWFESTLASTAAALGIGATGATAAVAGATYAYSVGAAAGASWMSGLSAVGASDFLTGIGVSLVGSGEAAAGFAAGAISVAVIAAIGIILIGAIIYLYEQAKAHYTKEFFHSSLMFLYASAYITANYKNQTCTGKITDEYPEQQQVYNNIMSSSNSTLKSVQASIAKGTNDSNICPESHWTDPVSWFRASLCGLGVALNELGNSFYLFAEKQLLSVLGLAYKSGY